MTLTRRHFLARAGHGLLGAAVASAIPGAVGRAIANSATAPRRRFVFVINQGGWDPLMVFAPMFGSASIEMPPASAPATIAGLPLVDSPLRPATRAFFERHGHRALLLHGLAVRSVAHDVCELTMMTGHATGGAADFATRLSTLADTDALPHLVLAGPVYPGALASRVARAGASGQLQELVSGAILHRSDEPVRPLRAPSQRVVDDFVRRRAAAWAESGGPIRATLGEAHGRASQLEDLRWEMSFASDGSLLNQVNVAVQALAGGVARCVTISPPLSWDTHTDSDNQQTQLFEALFVGLERLMSQLATTPAPGGDASRALREDTVVVVLSEMARTPRLNADNGRDHWPWTTALLLGDGLTGGRAVGGYDAGYAGQGIDPTSGELAPGADAPTPAQLGATLLALADLDPALAGPGVDPLLGVLA